MTSVLHVHNPAGAATHLSEAQQKRGMKSDVFVTHDRFEFGYDYCYKIESNSSDESLWQRLRRKIGELRKIITLARDYDIVHFHSMSCLDYPKPFFPRGIDDPVYLLSGTRVVLHHHGSDIRGIGEPWFHRLFADEILVSTPDLLEWTPDGTWVPNPVDIGQLPFKEPAITSSPYTVCHAPTDRKSKGTDAVIQAVDTLADAGYDITLDLVEGVTRSEVLDRFAAADVVVDQLNLGWYGLVSIEAMALGKPVCVYLNRELEPDNFQSPLVNVDHETLADELAQLLENPDRRRRLAHRGREFVERTHDPEMVAQQVSAVYERIL